MHTVHMLVYVWCVHVPVRVCSMAMCDVWICVRVAYAHVGMWGVCVCVWFGCMCVVLVCALTGVHLEVRGGSVSLFEAVFLTEPGTQCFQLGWLASALPGTHLCLPILGYRHAQPCPAFT